MRLVKLIELNSFDDIVGQDELISKGSLLEMVVSTRSFSSLIFTGASGTGKTSMAKVIGKMIGSDFISLHAASTGIAELKHAVDSATKDSIIFIDEIHRYSKSQQDLLIKLIDDGKIKLIGASAENPHFSLTAPLRSRSLIFHFKPLDDIALRKLAKLAEPYIKAIFSIKNIYYDNVIDEIISLSGNDGRRFLDLIELSALMGDRDNDTLILSNKGLENLIAKRRFNDDEEADLFSAMIKSIRGSDPDAALLWGMKLYKSGVQIDAIYRRMMVSCAEDIGNAYPGATIFLNANYNNFIHVGVPEGLIIFSHALTYLASVPKSNRSYLAYHSATADLERQDNDMKVPETFRYTSKTYKYPFDYGEFVKQNYLPEEKLQYYNPSDVGFEEKIKSRLAKLWGDMKNYDIQK